MSDGPRYEPIGSYALLSDCHSSALVSTTGSIDWACLRRFDAGSVFCRLLDAERGGYFQIRPRGLRSTRRAYLADTNVLETTFVTDTGAARLLDCFSMRHGGGRHPYRQLLRVVEGVKGEVSFEVAIEPRFDYGSLPPWLRHHPHEGVYSAVGCDDAFVLTAGCELAIDPMRVSLAGRFSVRRRQRCRFSLVSHPAHAIALERVSNRAIDRRLVATAAWWRGWVARGHFGGPHRDAVVRSALVLKALTCAPTGAIIAAPTTSLPEAVGGARNWDYRYSWIRDSTLTLSALFAVGHFEVAQGFKRFIERTTAGRAQDLQIMYGCYGERRLPELELPHLEGYRGSRPVRIGNRAAEQRQLDVFGELLDAWHVWRKMGNWITDDEWRFLRGLVSASCELWSQPDRGLWEIRGAPRHFVHSKVMCWVALDRGIQLAEETGLACDLDRWRGVREAIRAAVDEQGVDPERGCFVQAFGSRELDANLLLLPVVGFVPATEPRMLATVAAIEKDLSVDGLIRRYRPERAGDGLRGGEGAFLMASFWMVEVLAMQGRLDEAERLLARLLDLGNDVGLYAEEYSFREGHLGNFPQAFTHMALINAATHLEEARAHGVWGRSSAGDRAAVRHARRRGAGSVA